MEEYEEIEPKPLPRWVTIPLGIIFTPFTPLCVIGSAIILVAPNVPPTLLTISLGSLFLAGSLWVFYLSLRLLFVNPKGKSKFMSPVGLKVIALVFAAIPTISIILGTFWEKPIIHSVMTIAYIGIVLRLWGVANHRRENA
jgi:ABC-type microcin C transport system permease subunit YejB